MVPKRQAHIASEEYSPKSPSSKTSFVTLPPTEENTSIPKKLNIPQTTDAFFKLQIPDDTIPDMELQASVIPFTKAAPKIRIKAKTPVGVAINLIFSIVHISLSYAYT